LFGWPALDSGLGMTKVPVISYQIEKVQPEGTGWTIEVVW
jgi:hypothetical protein